MNEIENKEIEEMARAMCGLYHEIEGKYLCEEMNLRCRPCKHYERAETLYNAGYRNCKDKVVLDKEEWEVLHNGYAKSLCNARQDERKETAREILKALKNMSYQSNDWSHGVHPMVVEVDYIEDLAEEYGVEVE